MEAITTILNYLVWPDKDQSHYNQFLSIWYDPPTEEAITTILKYWFDPPKQEAITTILKYWYDPPREGAITTVLNYLVFPTNIGSHYNRFKLLGIPNQYRKPFQQF